MKKDIILIGADLEIVELINEIIEFELIGILDKFLKNDYYGYKILGTDVDLNLIKSDYPNALVCISLDSPSLKNKLFTHYSLAGFKFGTIISPKAKISRSSNIEEGVIIQDNCFVGSNVKLNKCVKLNVGANIMHDGTIDEFTTIAPNAITLGYVKIGNRNFVGANATILPNIHTGANVVIGAGAVVTKNIPEGITVAGVPAKRIK